MNPLFSTLNTSISNLSLTCSYDNKVRQTVIETLVQKYGKDSLSYLSLEGDKKHFIDKNLYGFIAYVVIQNIAVCLGNPVCQSTNSVQVFNEFKEFCKEHRLQICFCSITENFAELLKKNGFYISKYGEEALLDLTTYTLSGGKTEKLRQKLRRAEKSGTRIEEYFPGIYRDHKLEEKIYGLTQGWLMNKKGQLTFTLGDLNFDNPLGRRFFVAFDMHEEVVSILMFSPFDGQNGYFLDVMRRKAASVPGVMEKAIVYASMKMKSEGTSWISLGLAPLAGIDLSNPETTSLEKLFSVLFQYGTSNYNFQSLYQYKKKFNPSCWKTRYVAHETGISTIKVAYAMAKARNVDGILKQIITGLVKYIAKYQIPQWLNKKVSGKILNASADLFKNKLHTRQADNESIDYT